MSCDNIEQLRKERYRLFDENFHCKTDNPQEILNFCQKLRDITNIQTCNYSGSLYEYFPRVCRSVLDKDEM